MAKRSSSVWLLAVYALVALSAATAPTAEANGFNDAVKNVVNAWNGAVDAVKNKVETTFDFDWNKDGQIGKFRSVEDDEVNTRQVSGDNNAAGRFQQSRPRTGRMLKQEGEKVAEPAPVSYSFRSQMAINQVSGDNKAADRFKQSRPRSG